jgi:beta-xylosidase
VLEQGDTPVNGPHQGAWVDTPSGESWFFHFQEIDAIGRVTHLQPVTWKDGWPVMGVDRDGDGKGQPVLVHQKPAVGGTNPVATPQVSDEFNGPEFGPQWQWSANGKTEWASSSAAPGFLRLFVQPENGIGSLWHQPSVLSQRISGPASTVTTKLALDSKVDGTSAGLVVMGDDYAWIGLRRGVDSARVVLMTGKGAKNVAPKDAAEVASAPWTGGAAWLRMTNHGEKCRFSFSADGKTFTPLGDEFIAKQWGSWVGARVGLFAFAPRGVEASGHADVDWFYVTEPVAE